MVKINKRNNFQANNNVIMIVILILIIILLTIIAVKLNTKIQKCSNTSSDSCIKKDTIENTVREQVQREFINNIDNINMNKGINTAENSSAPVYPERDPRYPVRNKNIGYQQVGVLVSNDLGESEPVILPLFGRKMNSRDRWNYYCASDKYHMWKLPVVYKNRDCQVDLGCDEIYDGDDVTVPDYANKVFRARIYKYSENQTL